MTEPDSFIPTGKNEVFLKTIIQESLDGIMVIDADGVVRFANPAAKAQFKGMTADLEGFFFGTPAIEENVEIIIPSDRGQRTIEMRSSDITWQGETAQLAMLREITDRVKIEQELREQERLVSETNTMARVGGWKIDLNTHTVWWSEFTRQMHELPDDITPTLEEALSFFPEQAREKLRSEIEHLTEEPGSYDLVVPLITARGHHLWVRTIGQSEFKSGKPQRIWGTIQDITERRQAELDLIQSEKRYRTLYEEMAQGVLYVDRDGTYSGANLAAEKILGVSIDEMEGRSCTDPSRHLIKLTGEAMAPEECPVSRALRTGLRMADVVYGIVNPVKKNTVWLNVTAIPLFHPGEAEPYQVFATILDISDQVEADRLIRESEKKFRTLFEEMAEGVVYQNAEGKIISANPAAERILGLSYDQLMGKESIDEDWQAIHQDGEPLPGEQHPAMVALRTGERVENFMLGVNNPGRDETAWINVSAVPQFRKGETSPYQVFATFLDITDRVRILNVLQERVKELSCIAHISMAIQKAPTISEICRIASVELMQAMQYPKVALTMVEMAGERYEQNGFSEDAENSLMTPITLHGEQIGKVRVCYPENKVFLIPEEKNLLDRVSERLASYYDHFRTLQSLKESEERFRTVVIEAPYPLAVFAEDGEILTINTAWTSFSGYELEEIPTISDWQKKAYGEESPETKARFERLFDGEGAVDEGEQRILAKDGEERIWYFRSSSLGRLSDGRRGVIRMATDITDRVAAEKMLEASEKQFRRAFESAPVPIMIHAEDGEVITINDVWSEISGYDLADIPTISDWTDKAYGPRKGETEEVIRKLYNQEGRSEEGKFFIRTKDGENRTWLFSSAPLGRTTDDRKTVISIAQDITDRDWYLQRLEALHEIDQTLNETLEIDEVLDLITTHLKRVIDFKFMSIMLLAQDRLHVIASHGFESPGDIIGLEFPNIPEYPNYRVIVEKKPFTYENVGDEFPNFTQPVDLAGMGKIKSWMGIPLIREGEVIGMLCVDRIKVDPFTKEEMDIALHYANRAAIAIHNAQLYEASQSQINRLAVLRKIDTLITSIPTLEEALPVILHEAQEGLDIDAAAILLYDEDTHRLVVENAIGLNSELHKENFIPLGQGYSGQVAEIREPIFIPEVVYADGNPRYPVDFANEAILSYYGLPLVIKGELIGIIDLYHRSKLDPGQEWVDFTQMLAGQVAIAINSIALFDDLQQANEDLGKAYEKTIEGWARALELRDQETEGHSQRVVALSLCIAREFGFGEDDLLAIQRGVLLHDIGKMGIPDDILRKPGPLTEEEWVIMRRHPLFAYNMLKDIDYLEPSLNIPHYHHERWDGSGYPEGLAGEEIPLEARIFMVADIWDALTSDRPYREAWSEEKTIAYLNEKAGEEMDPEVVKVFLEILKAEKSKDLDER